MVIRLRMWRRLSKKLKKSDYSFFLVCAALFYFLCTRLSKKLKKSDYSFFLVCAALFYFLCT